MLQKSTIGIICLVSFFLPAFPNAQEVPKEATAAAESYLHLSMSRKLIPAAQISKQGIKASEMDSAILGKPYCYYRATFDDVMNYRTDSDFLKGLQLLCYQFPILVNGKLCGAIVISADNLSGGWTSGTAENEFIIANQKIYTEQEGYSLSFLNVANIYRFILLKKEEDSLSIAPLGEKEASLFSGVTTFGEGHFVRFVTAISPLREEVSRNKRAIEEHRQKIKPIKQ